MELKPYHKKIMILKHTKERIYKNRNRNTSTNSNTNAKREAPVTDEHLQRNMRSSWDPQVSQRINERANPKLHIFRKILVQN